MDLKRYLALFTVIVITDKTLACSPTDTPQMTRSQRLLGADFVIKGEDLGHYSIIENGINITKARIAVHCVFKPDAQTRNVSSEIIVRDVGYDSPCQHTFINPGEVVILTLKESECVSAAGSNCEFLLHAVSPWQSAAFLASESLMIDISRACEFQNYHPPKALPGKEQQNSCHEKYSGQCHYLSGGNSFGKQILPVVAVCTMLSLILSTFLVCKRFGSVFDDITGM